MTQDRDFQQFGFAQYSQPRRSHSSRAGLLERVFGPSIAAKLSSPLVATGAFLLVGAAFAGIILASYPDDGGEQALPVVKADTLAYKETPADPGGMDIDNRDSTIFMSMRGDSAVEGAPVENLLSDEDASRKLEEFAQQVEAVAAQDNVADAPAAPAKIENLLDGPDEVAAVDAAQDVQVDVPVPAPAKPEPVSVPEVQENALANVEPTKPVMPHKAGSNPETLEFVRSVLDKKDGRVAAAAPAMRTPQGVSDVASQAAHVQPAAGAAITAGSHYVQLGSVKSMSGAESEWGKLQKQFTELSGVAHRVKSADLGERGIFYRIQAGPMSKDSAGTLCDSIKAQKPGGCLVTQ